MWLGLESYSLCNRPVSHLSDVKLVVVAILIAFILKAFRVIVLEGCLELETRFMSVTE
jgi:hypothetical protein